MNRPGCWGSCGAMVPNLLLTKSYTQRRLWPNIEMPNVPSCLTLKPFAFLATQNSTNIQNKIIRTQNNSRLPLRLLSLICALVTTKVVSCILTRGVFKTSLLEICQATLQELLILYRLQICNGVVISVTSNYQEKLHIATKYPLILGRLRINALPYSCLIQFNRYLSDNYTLLPSWNLEKILCGRIMHYRI